MGEIYAIYNLSVIYVLLFMVPAIYRGTDQRQIDKLTDCVMNNHIIATVGEFVMFSTDFNNLSYFSESVN